MFKSVRNEMEAQAQIRKAQLEEERNRKTRENNRQQDANRRVDGILARFNRFFAERLSFNIAEKYPELFARNVRENGKNKEYAELYRKREIAQAVTEQITSLPVVEMNSVMEAILGRFVNDSHVVTDDEIFDFFERMSHVEKKYFAKFAERLRLPSYAQAQKDNEHVKQEVERLLRQKQMAEEGLKKIEQEVGAGAWLQMMQAKTRAKSPEKARAKSPEKQSQTRAKSPEKARAKSPEKRVSESFFTEDRKAKQMTLARK